MKYLNLPVLRQQKRAMRSFHDYDLPRRYFPGRHGMSTHVTSVVLDLHCATTSRISRIPLLFEDKLAAILLGTLTGQTLLVINSGEIVRGRFVELFALIHHREHHPDVRLELLFALQRYPGVVQSLESSSERLDRRIMFL